MRAAEMRPEIRPTLTAGSLTPNLHSFSAAFLLHLVAAFVLDQFLDLRGRKISCIHDDYSEWPTGLVEGARGRIPVLEPEEEVVGDGGPALTAAPTAPSTTIPASASTAPPTMTLVTVAAAPADCIAANTPDAGIAPAYRADCAAAAMVPAPTPDVPNPKAHANGARRNANTIRE